MSSSAAPVPSSTTSTIDASGSSQNLAKAPPPVGDSKRNYKGFVAGVFSGIAKLSGEFVYASVSALDLDSTYVLFLDVDADSCAVWF